MIGALQADPVRDLSPIGGTAVGIIVPTIILLISIGVSIWLYRHFVTKRAD
jgi:hypothetical protein